MPFERRRICFFKVFFQPRGSGGVFFLVGKIKERGDGERMKE